jgi:hypothetical protein
MEINNTGSEFLPLNQSIQFSINPLSTNTISGELVVELIDANMDGQASLLANAGGGDAIQAVTVAGNNIGLPLGADILSPGLHSFVLSPMSGPTPGGTFFSLNTNISLSPGDTALITSRFIIDENSGIPFAEIPSLPDPDNGPFFNVINVDSPETSIGNDLSIGAQTQLNLLEGGTIGTNFTAGDSLFLTPDIEVNITGGTIGSILRAHNESVVNISGGTTGDIFVLGNSQANVSGGNLGFLRVFSGTTNISAGVLAGLRIDDGQLNVTGGTVNTTVAADGGVTTISGGNFNASTSIRPNGGEVNITGGTFAGGCSLCITTAGSGSVVNVSGGSFGTSLNGLFAVAGANAVINIFGGTFAPLMVVRADNELHFFGTEFLLDGVPIEGLVYGQPFEIAQRNVALSGLLADGSTLGIDLNSVEMAGADAVSPAALLTVTLILPGDYNHNGIVDAADYTVWRNNLGQTDLAFYTGGDGNGDGHVTAADYDVWKSRFGDTPMSAGAGGQQSAVPEAGTSLLSWCGLLISGVVIRRRTN